MSPDLKTFTLLVECFPWASYVDSPNCLDTTLILNEWATEEELATLGDTEKKSKMVESLHLLLNPEIHSLPDLGKREMVSDQGGLCGLAVLYHALVSTIATSSMLRKLDYDTMRELMASEINVKRSKIPEYIDSALLTEFHECKTACYRKEKKLYIELLTKSKAPVA